MNYDSVKTGILFAMKVAILTVTVLAANVSAQTPLSGWPAATAPCQYYENGVEQLEYDEAVENRTQFFWVKRPHDGQIGDCSFEHGAPDACERVSYVVRTRTPRPVTGWQWPIVKSAIYHFDGGIYPADLCRRN